MFDQDTAVVNLCSNNATVIKNGNGVPTGEWIWNLHDPVVPASEAYKLAVRLEQFNCRSNFVSIHEHDTLNIQYAVDGALKDAEVEFGFPVFYKAQDILTRLNAGALSERWLTFTYDDQTDRFTASVNYDPVTGDGAARFLPAAGTERVFAFDIKFDPNNESSSRLWRILGFGDNQVKFTHTPGEGIFPGPGTWNSYTAILPPDLVGTRFIKVLTSLSVANIDPSTLTYNNVLAVVPISQPKVVDGYVYYSATTNSGAYSIIGDTEINRISIKLVDDLDNAVVPTGTFFIQLAFESIKPPPVQPYRGLRQLPWHLMYGQDPTGNSYKKARTNEIGNIGGLV